MRDQPPRETPGSWRRPTSNSPHRDFVSAFKDGSVAEKVSGALKPILAADIPISQPVPLASDGTKIAASALPASAVWLTFDVYPSVAFSVFNLE